MSKRALIEDLIERMQMCLDDDFENFAISDVKNWIVELEELAKNLNLETHSPQTKPLQKVGGVVTSSVTGHCKDKTGDTSSKGCGKRFRRRNSLLYCGNKYQCDECQERHKSVTESENDESYT